MYLHFLSLLHYFIAGHSGIYVTLYGSPPSRSIDINRAQNPQTRQTQPPLPTVRFPTRYPHATEENPSPQPHSK